MSILSGCNGVSSKSDLRLLSLIKKAANEAFEASADSKPSKPEPNPAPSKEAMPPEVMLADRRPAPSSASSPRGPAIKPLALSSFRGGLQAAKRMVNKVRVGFLKLFGKQLSGGLIILKKPDKHAVSEGMGFGSLIVCSTNAVGTGGLLYSSGNNRVSQNAYWQLYKARKAYFLKSNGVMAWKVSPNGRKLSTISAADGDQDWIASAITVYQKLKRGLWKMPRGMSLAAFKSEILKDLAAFWKVHIKRINRRYFFLATDGSWAKRGDGREIYYASYPDPHFLRRFSRFDRRYAWAKVASDIQALNKEILKKHRKLGAVGQNPMPAKVFVMVTSGGRFVVENYYTRSRREGVTGVALKDNELDSIRFLLRAARTAILDRDKTAQSMLKKILRIAKITGPTSAHILAGSKGAPSKWGWNNTTAKASYGIAVLGSGDTARAENFFKAVLRDHKGYFFGEWDGAKNYYYDQALILQIMDLAINR